jgi:hypothetical protein
MKALEFRTRLKNNQIQIPVGVRSELKNNGDKEFRVIVLLDDSENNDDLMFRETAGAYFLKGYADSDSVYDKS